MQLNGLSPCLQALSPGVDSYEPIWQNRLMNLASAGLAPVAQRIERRPPKPKARVRVTAGVFG